MGTLRKKRATDEACPARNSAGAGSNCKPRRRSEGAEVAEGTVDLALTAGLWGVLLAVPGVIVWLWRRLQQKPD